MGGQALGALGLRGRIVGAVLVTAVAALAVAAVVLLGPLEHSLRNAELATLESQVPPSTRASFRKYDPSLAYYYDVSKGTNAERKKGKHVWEELFALERALGARSHVDANEVAVLGYSGASRPYWVVAWPDQHLVAGDPADDAAKAFQDQHWHYTLGSIRGTDYARAAIPFTTLDTFGPYRVRQHWVLIVRKSLVEVSSAFAAVRTAFLVAALVALALTLILGIPLSARIVRRLRVLRHAALRLAHGGPEVKIPVDRARDEVGDLARSFAIMQTQLQHQEEARRAFVATASHELRTPLATLDGMLEMLQEDLRSGNPDPEDAESLLERARAQSHRLGRLAADLLDLSRIDAQVELRSEPVELGELSRAVLAEFELGTADRRISTTLDDAIGPVWAMGDPGSVARIVRILIDNAVRLSPVGSEITIELRNGDRASISVCDQGPGVAPDERDLIFERFMRGRQVAGPPGFGLGLAIGRELAERMGGELVLEERDGPGARFTLRLPVAQAPDAEPVAVA
ncbi:MAG TPA: HAMP domain-containing sensor histidine kinase [Solirubrobacteraceae bacterium]|nr:HAMP domain-containing sensor histidine kinase [Solirubrobacteraceae bacterium]